ncbi:MDR family MFS transporter [Ornithinibacillus halotolerans]|uniref:MFS-type transporter YttB n=1 Tax=Ornithinibacillus halotolerans TaxID=1274357 RepID=A0A916RRI7_9BACI|nr:MFS transporter [Ornithinibacillus halotolerans]GGA66960.1 putative MFS-type transporter YttB [Ornithinibacillus halotolerans]
MPKYIWLLAVATTISVTGGSFLWPLNTIYMHNELGKSLAFAGFILMFNQGANIVGNLVGGILFDKFSAYKTILFGALLSTSAATFLTFNHDIVAYSICLLIIGLGSGITWPVMYAMAGSVWPEGGRRTFNAIYVAQNLGVALGAMIGGYVASISFDYIFIANASLLFVFTLIVIFAFRGMDEEKNRHMHTNILEQSGQIKDKSAFTSLIILSVGFFVTWFAYSQWQSTIASYTQDIGVPLEQYSTLWAINGFLIVLGQPLLKLFTDRVTSPKTHIYVGASIFLFSFVIAMYAEAFTMFAVAMVILTIAEMLIWPAIPTLANALAPAGRAGFYQGFINSVAAAGRMLGPFLGGLVVDMYNIEVLFYCLLVLLLVPFFTTKIYNRTGKQDQVAEKKA